MQIKIPSILRITNPLWVEKLESRTTWKEVNKVCEIKGIKLNIGDYQCCIVGETFNLFNKNWSKYEYDHGGNHTLEEISTSYHDGCKPCSDFSMELFYSIKAMTCDVKINRLEKELERYAKHLEESHPDIIEEARKNAKD